ncbi:hypothetical protein IMX26_10395 [Clostridium sp. 'deep sea']|uniref:hypothetical protein n=1 Tax=Clostridium sp. 'deep sea' TaxID=2779445 RepID=UPI0018963FA4|nr:hypothetical protein [Clostridium sp. 'deep sea']QOR33901.1 hypothetical protein IMX26_10395 [Clostridium sp. 'deep sea']
MKLTKLTVLVAVLCLLVAGSALAWGGPGGNSQQLAAGNTYRNPQANVVAELTGKTVDEVRELCSELQDEGKTIVDYLKEQNLYEEFKTETFSNFEEKFSNAVENGNITQERADELLNQVKDKIDNGTFCNGTKSGLNLKTRAGKGMGNRGRGRRCN